MLKNRSRSPDAIGILKLSLLPDPKSVWMGVQLPAAGSGVACNTLLLSSAKPLSLRLSDTSSAFIWLNQAGL